MRPAAPAKIGGESLERPCPVWNVPWLNRDDEMDEGWGGRDEPKAAVMGFLFPGSTPTTRRGSRGYSSGALSE